MDQPVIQTLQLDHQFGKHKVLQQVSLNMPKGSIYGFLGPNGAGKTTTIRLLLGLLKPTQGEVLLFNESLSTHRIPMLQKIGSLIEMPSLYLHLTGRENLRNACILRNIPYAKIDEVLALVRLTKDANRKVKEYSLGMKQRLGLAIALLPDPSLLILDEPTNGLDPNGIIEMRELLKQLNRERGISIFISSHLLSEMEKVATHIGIIHHGRMMFQGTLQELQSLKVNGAYLQVDCSDQERAVQIFTRESGLVMLNGSGFKLPYQSKEHVAQLIQTLVREKIDVYQVQVNGNDLENLFLYLTEKQAS
ncbi:ABC-2 type transport system ATP-binding protein [Chitinophaga skermanii]|uniref:ABC-2 type transport system ATP-binding protein n=1 Tax=Chitinophaga skermanii TaxID=331697 RepID=A0A327QVU8_9BACT|nr:ABC transporter ATP-binding protein [Chitinophaga skermanii]RAJ08520.1 ABC-2 type transport system ATP-binding protein [Chitinophaga skermanii]